jgi:hypothetical protein
VTDARAAGIVSARAMFDGEGLALPGLPASLEARIERRGEWCWSTEPLEETPYLVDEFVRAFEDDPTHDIAVLAHAGHGRSSWALCSYIAFDAVGTFVHVAWGSALDDTGQDDRARQRFATLVEATSALHAEGRSPGQGRAGAAVVSDFVTSRWATWSIGDTPMWTGADEPVTDLLAALDR